jgi:hypothetical protein
VGVGVGGLAVVVVVLVVHAEHSVKIRDFERGDALGVLPPRPIC